MADLQRSASHQLTSPMEFLREIVAIAKKGQTKEKTLGGIVIRRVGPVPNIPTRNVEVCNHPMPATELACDPRLQSDESGLADALGATTESGSPGVVKVNPAKNRVGPVPIVPTHNVEVCNRLVPATKLASNSRLQSDESGSLDVLGATTESEGTGVVKVNPAKKLLCSYCAKSTNKMPCSDCVKSANKVLCPDCGKVYSSLQAFYKHNIRRNCQKFKNSLNLDPRRNVEVCNHPAPATVLACDPRLQRDESGSADVLGATTESGGLGGGKVNPAKNRVGPVLIVPTQNVEVCNRLVPATMEDFFEWKAVVEKQTSSRFTIDGGCKKVGNKIKYAYYTCERNFNVRTHQKKGQPFRKTEIRHKKGTLTNVNCPARMNLKITSEGVNVTYMPTHANHIPGMSTCPQKCTCCGESFDDTAGYINHKLDCKHLKPLTMDPVCILQSPSHNEICVVGANVTITVDPESLTEEQTVEKSSNKCSPYNNKVSTSNTIAEHNKTPLPVTDSSGHNNVCTKCSRSYKTPHSLRNHKRICTKNNLDNSTCSQSVKKPRKN